METQSAKKPQLNTQCIDCKLNIRYIASQER